MNRDNILKEIRRLKKELTGRDEKPKEPCNKRTYTTKEGAKKHVLASKHWPSKKKLKDYYYCDKCKGWHTTSKDQKQYWRKKKFQ